MKVVNGGIGYAISYAIDTAKEMGDHDTIRNLAPLAITEAKHGNGDCAVRLAQAYRDGQGVEWDLDKSIFWFKKAYDLKVFWCKPEYYDVLKWKCDEYQKQMFEIAQSGAEDGNAMSMVQLGRCFRYGYGTKIDMFKSKEWIERGIKSGADWAKPELDQIISYQRGCPFWKN